jgi:hypothetical protein
MAETLQENSRRWHLARGEFPTMPERQHDAEMFRADVEAAGIPYRDDAGLAWRLIWSRTTPASSSACC